MFYWKSANLIISSLIVFVNYKLRKEDHVSGIPLKPGHTRRQVAATSRRDKSPRQFASCDMVNFCDNHCRWGRLCRCDRLHAFKPVWILIAATKLAKAALSHRVYTFGNKSLRQNINEPMRECHIFSHNPPYWIRKLVHIPPHTTSLRVDRHCRRVAATCFASSTKSQRPVAATCRL